LESGRLIFRCRRGSHGEITRTFDTLEEAKRFRTSHDVEQHGENAPVAYRRSATIGSAADELLDHLELLVARGKKDGKTLKDYRDLRSRLTEIFGVDRALETIDLAAARHYVRQRLTRGIEYNGRLVRTSGARVLKELKFLERLARDSNISFGWSAKKHFEDDLKEERRDATSGRRAIPAEKLVRFIASLGGVARAFVVTKVLTGMRNEELYNLRVGDVDFESGVIRYIARAKRKRIAAVALITPEVGEVLAPLAQGSESDAWLFTCRGRKVQQSSFRKQFLKASAEAGISVAADLTEGAGVGGVAWIRHAVMTAIRPRVGVDAVSKYANHSSVTVTEAVYDLDREALDLKAQAVEQVRRLLQTPCASNRDPNGGIQ
jgi:integrase